MLISSLYYSSALNMKAMTFQRVGLFSADYVALYPRRQNYSKILSSFELYPFFWKRSINEALEFMNFGCFMRQLLLFTHFQMLRSQT
jgi:hypothetical protein